MPSETRLVTRNRTRGAAATQRRMIAENTFAEVVTLDTHHTPQLSMTDELARAGFRTLPSQANFIMIDMGREVKPLIAAMRQRNVHVGRLFPAMPKHLRVTIGRPEEMTAFLTAFKAVIA